MLINLLLLVYLSTAVDRIAFIGNRTFSDRTLRSVIYTKKGGEVSEINFLYDSEKIVRHYRRFGYFATAVDYRISRQGEKTNLEFLVREGIRPLLERVMMRGADEFDVKQIKRRLLIKPGDYFLDDRIRLSKDNLENYLKDLGRPYAQVTTIVQPDSGYLLFEVDPGEIYYVREIRISGLKECHPRVLRKEIDIQRGDRYSRQQMRNCQRRLYSLGFFSTVDVELIRGQTDSLDLNFTVRELKSRLLNFGVGVSANYQSEGEMPVNFITSLGVEELNLFNRGHRFLIQPSFSFGFPRRWEAKIEGRYTIPYVTALRLTVSTLPFYDLENTKEYERRTIGNELRVSKNIRENIQISVANQLKKIDFQSVSDVADTFRGATNSLKLQAIVDLRDDFFNPRRGYYLVPLVEYAGGVFGGDNHFVRLETEERFFLPLGPHTIAQRLKIGGLIPTGDVRPEEKYHLGGQYSLRGYNDRSLGPDSLYGEHFGNILCNFNLEFRMMVIRNFSLLGFSDFGTLVNRLDAQTEFTVGVGAGLRYYTPIGPLRFDAGIPATPWSWSDFKIHLGFYNIY